MLTKSLKLYFSNALATVLSAQNSLMLTRSLKLYFSNALATVLSALSRTCSLRQATATI